jgi:hypothetical protein
MMKTSGRAQMAKNLLPKEDFSAPDTGFTLVQILVVLVILFVAISWLVIGFSRTDVHRADHLPQVRSTEMKSKAQIDRRVAQGRSAESDYQANMEARTAAGNLFADAKQALADGECYRAGELTTKAIIQIIATVKATGNGTGDMAESYEQAKKKVLPIVKEIWAFLDEISKARANNMCSAEGPADAYAEDARYEARLDERTETADRPHCPIQWGFPVIERPSPPWREIQSRIRH